MSVILLPSRFKQQPQRNVPLHPEWLARGLVVACNPAVGAYNQVTKKFVTNSGGMGVTPASRGRSWDGGSGKYIDFGAGYGNSTGATVIQIVNPGSLVNQFTFSSRLDSSASGIEVLVGEGGVAGRAMARIWKTAFITTPNLSGLDDGKDHVLAVRWTPSTELAIWADNAANRQTTSSGIPDSISPSQNLRLHSRAATYYTGKSGLFLYFDNPLSDSLVQQLLDNPSVIYQAPARRIWLVPAVSSHDLVGAASTQSNAASTVAITQAHALTGTASTQANAAATGAITQGGSLAADNVIQSNAGSTGSITQTHALVADSATQGNTASTGAITQGAQFAADPATQPNTAGTGAISQAHALSGPSSTQPNTASAASITQAHVLAGAGATQANTSPSAAISTGVVHNLAASQSTQANAGQTGAITQAHILVSAPSIQDNIAAASAIVQAHILAALSATQSNSASSGAITAGDNALVSIVERTAVFQRSKSVTVRFN